MLGECQHHTDNALQIFCEVAKYCSLLFCKKHLYIKESITTMSLPNKNCFAYQLILSAQMQIMQILARIFLHSPSKFALLHKHIQIILSTATYTYLENILVYILASMSSITVRKEIFPRFLTCIYGKLLNIATYTVFPTYMSSRYVIYCTSTCIIDRVYPRKS